MLDALAKRKRLGNFRSLSNAQQLVDFASNDYLGLARKKIDISHSKRGSSGSRLLTGNSVACEALERQIATYHRSETALVFNCGYMANIGLFQAVSGPEDVFFFDANVHASIRDGLRLCKARYYPFRHNDLTHLKQRLEKHSNSKNLFICIESVYSTDGSQAPISKMLSLADEYDAKLIIDEAHATGIFDIQRPGVFAQVITFSKALGCFGAAILGSNQLKQMLINFARSFIYTTALPNHALSAIESSYALLPHLSDQQERLRRLIKIAGRSPTPIQPFFISGNAAIQAAARHLAKEGFDVRALLSPTVQRGKEVLRVCLHAFNSENELKQLLSIIRAYE